MVGNMIRVMRARMTLLAMDEAGMSTVEYSIVQHYTASETGTRGLTRYLGTGFMLVR